ncbi:IS110 family transposase [Arthrobacter sp. HLT1-21]
MTDLNSTRSGHIVVGVDTHKHIHVAAVMDTIGGILATLTIPTDTGGFWQLLAWAEEFGRILWLGRKSSAGSSRSGSRAPAPTEPR